MGGMRTSRWAGWVLIIAILAQNGSPIDGLDEDSPTLIQDPDLSKLMLGDPSPGELQEQNTQLQGAITAIESGVPPPGMEAMLGGAPSEGGDGAAGGAAGAEPGAPGAGAAGAAAGGAAESSAISKGIKMAMTSVKPLMDKYVATARALTNKYSLLKKRYKIEKAKSDACPTDEQITAKVEAAVKAEREAGEAKYEALQAKSQKQLEDVQARSDAMIDKLQLQVTKLKTFNEAGTAKFKVEMKQARETAKDEVGQLHETLKNMMMSELKKRDAAIELEKKKEAKEREQKKEEAKATEQKQKADKKAADDAQLAKERAAKAKEKIRKKRESDEKKVKDAAAEEMKTLNRETVMVKARKAVEEARKAARMARKLSRDADVNVDNARLKLVKDVTEDDVKALSKLRHHEDLALTAVDSASEKREKVSRFKYTAQASLDKSEHRIDAMDKKNRWESRHVQTLKDIAKRARDKAAHLKKVAETAAANAGMEKPDIELPQDMTDTYTPGSTPGSGTNDAIASAHAARAKAREALEKEGMPIPKSLEPGQMDVLKTQVEAADQAAEVPANSPTEPKRSGRGASPGSTSGGHAKREKLRRHAEVRNAKIKTQIAHEKLDVALEKREKARVALRKENKQIPDTLKKGGLDEEKEKLAAAAAKATAAAEALEQKEETAKTNKGQLADEAIEEIDDASAKRETAREYLQQEGQPIPKSLEKGGMKQVREEAEENKDKATHGETEISPKDSKKTTSVKKQVSAVDAALKAELATVKVDKARGLRQKARDALTAKGKPIPDSLSKGAFAPIKGRADAALQKAKALKAKAAEDAASAGTAPEGTVAGQVATCYEAELAKYPKCGGYKDEGFYCSDPHEDGVSGHCAADKCIGTCDKCSKKAPQGYVVDIKTGRCKPPEDLFRENEEQHAQ